MLFQSFITFCLAILWHGSLCPAKVYRIKNPILDYLKIEPETPHELVNIQVSDRLDKRGIRDETMPRGQRIQIKAFGKQVSLWLHPIKSVLATNDTPVYFSSYSPDSSARVTIEKQQGLMEKVGQILEDPEYQASVTLGRDEYEETIVHGRIGLHNWIIRSLPRRVLNEYVRQGRSVDDSNDGSMDSMNHVVYVIGDQLKENHAISAINRTRLWNRIAQSTGGIPYFLYPKVLVVVDYSIYKEQGQDIHGLLQYVMAFMNGVDLRYREVRTPSIEFFIAGILIAQEPKAIPYISENMVKSGRFQLDDALLHGARFFYEIRDSIPLESYDIALTLSRFEMDTNENELVSGGAYMGTVCENKTDLRIVYSLTFAMDDGAFSGIQSAAHEIGHAFGLRHDHHQSRECDERNGFLMATYDIRTSKSSSLSPCSLRRLEKKVNSGNFKCLYKQPEVGGSQKLPRLMPGRLKNLQEQCSARGFQQPCFDYTGNEIVDVCLQFKCLNDQGQCEETYMAAAEGTICSDENDVLDKYCVHNRCSDLDGR